MELRSSAFTNNTRIPARFSRDGENVSPPLEWAGLPDEAVELALICEDPDAPRGTFVHWLVGGIAPMDAALDVGQTQKAPWWDATISATPGGTARSRRPVLPTGTTSGSTR